MLNNVVSVLVFNQISVVPFDLIQRFVLFMLWTVFQNSLQDSATVGVTGKRPYIVQHIIDYEIDLGFEKFGLIGITRFGGFLGLFTHDLDAFLNYMIAILVMNAT
mmetsp:Transcript_118984/g.344144  ORF Transcript_118984/g.344144 Transcript_118984/m.344144 type:complete len:105 (+) Transcript_118984:1841-2155(+)